MSVILETKQLCKFYGAGENQVKAVNQVDIQIEHGEFVAIVGKSGSGKSTLLHMLGGLDTPTKSSVTLAGKDLYRMKEDALAVFRREKSAVKSAFSQSKSRFSIPRVAIISFTYASSTFLPSSPSGSTIFSQTLTDETRLNA